jgi:hypothetical protein
LIAEEAFDTCTNLNEIHSKNPNPPVIYSSTFYGINGTCILYVPKGAKSTYQIAAYWRSFANIIEE